MPFVQHARGMVLLMCVKFQRIRRKALGEGDQTRSPALTPLAGINKHPVDVRTLHREIRYNLLLKRTDPEIALAQNDFPKDHASAVKRERLP